MTELLITTFDSGVLWDDFGIRSDVVVRDMFAWINVP